MRGTLGGRHWFPLPSRRRTQICTEDVGQTRQTQQLDLGTKLQQKAGFSAKEFRFHFPGSAGSQSNVIRGSQVKRTWVSALFL